MEIPWIQVKTMQFGISPEFWSLSNSNKDSFGKFDKNLYKNWDVGSLMTDQLKHMRKLHDFNEWTSVFKLEKSF